MAHPLNQMAIALGHALMNWQVVELQMYSLFVDASLCPLPETASTIFYQIQSASTRLQLLDEVLKIAVTSEVRRSQWKQLSGQTVTAIANRNRIAHFTVVDNEGAPCLQTSPWDYIAVNGKKSKNPNNRIDLSGVNRIGKQFFYLQEALKDFREECRASGEMPRPMGLVFSKRV